MSEQLRKIIESKRAYRSKLAALPFAEKIVLLGKLRGRALSIKASRGKTVGDTALNFVDQSPEPTTSQ